MIWHFVEVWLMVVLTFVVGCLGGAHLYGFVATTRLAPAQGAVADFVGDGIDRLKARLGLAPTWRPAHLRQIDRPIPPAAVAPVVVDPDPVADPVPAPLPAPPDEQPARSRAAVGTPQIGDRLRRPRARPAMRDAATMLPPPAPPEASPPSPLSPVVPMRPAGIASPRGGVPDNLQRIKGIGKRNERLLNEIGIFHFGQIAAWTPAEIEWIGDHLAFPDRIARDDWVGQATLLAMGSETGFQKSAERRRERRRQQRDFQDRMATASVAYHGDESDERGEVDVYVYDSSSDGKVETPDDVPAEDQADAIDDAPATDDVGLDTPLTGSDKDGPEGDDR